MDVTSAVFDSIKGARTDGQGTELGTRLSVLSQLTCIHQRYIPAMLGSRVSKSPNCSIHVPRALVANVTVH